MTEKCLYRCGKQEAVRHECGEAEWNRTHWWGWCAERYLEHLRGEVFWCQFDRESFALLARKDTAGDAARSRLTPFTNWRYRRSHPDETAEALAEVLNDMHESLAAGRTAGAAG
ncbi:MAG: hypothetical protein V1809_12335 [Planctomycetota bacterium]